MSKPYDVTLKAMFETSPGDWPRLAGFEPSGVEIIDADVSTVTAAADKVLRLAGAQRSLMHFEFQAGPDAGLPRRVLGYNTLLGQRHEMAVHSVVVLLRPEANLRNLNGLYEQYYPGLASPYLTFRYQVVRVWEIPAADLLQGGKGTLPLAPIGAIDHGGVREVIRQMRERLARPEFEQDIGELWTAAKVLMGLRFEDAQIEQLLQGVHRMKESVTYQAILNEGREEGREEGRKEGRKEARTEEARRILLRLGESRFKKPADAATRAAIEVIEAAETLEELIDGVYQVGSWEELVPGTPTRGGQKKSE